MMSTNQYGLPSLERSCHKLCPDSAMLSEKNKARASYALLSQVRLNSSISHRKKTSAYK